MIPGRRVSNWRSPRAVATVVLGALLSILTTATVLTLGTGTAGATTGWQVDTSYPAVPGATAVACPTASNCFAVGTNRSGAGDILATTDGGTTWTSQSVPSGVTGLSGVACSSADSCFAVGSDSDLGTGVILATTDGSTWSSQSVPPGVGGLVAVACPATDTCYAVGFGDGGGVIVTTADGSTWATQTDVPSGRRRPVRNRLPVGHRLLRHRDRFAGRIPGRHHPGHHRRLDVDRSSGALGGRLQPQRRRLPVG